MSAGPPSIAPSAAALEFLARHHQLFIGGEWVAPAEPGALPVYDPATEELLTEVASASARDIDRAVGAAQTARCGDWPRITSHERSRLLWRLADEIEAHRDLITELEVLDNGMPRIMAYYNVKLCVTHLRYHAGWCSKLVGDTIPVSPHDLPNGESLTYTQREPIGVVAGIVPGQAPLLMALMKLAPALAAGCTIILKPAEHTPLTTLLLAELVNKVGIPAGVVNVLSGPGESTGAMLATHDGVDMISFTGPTAIGKKIVVAAAGNLKRVTLALSGKSPMVVFADADLKRVIPGAVRGAFFLQGQNCAASTRLFVHEDLFEPVVQGISQVISRFRLGPGLSPDSDLGPLLSARHRERVLAHIEGGRKSGAELVCGGGAVPGKGFFVQPTLFARTDMNMPIAREEIFGPVLCIQSFGDSDLGAVAAEANNCHYRLSASVWTRDISVAHRMVNLIDAGQVSINCHGAVDPAIPFGGTRQSGWGREFGLEGVEAYLKTKATSIKF